MSARRATRPGNGQPRRNGAPAREELLEVAVEHTTRVPTATQEQSAGEVRDAIVGSSFESAVDVAVIDGEALVGIVSIEALLAADPDARIDTVMDADPPVVEPGVDQEAAAWVMCRRGEASIAVVDSDGSFGGLIPPDRMLSVLLTEHDEDLARMGLGGARGGVRGTARQEGHACLLRARRGLHGRTRWALRPRLS